MRPRDWFAVGVRLFGVYVFYHAFAQWLGLLGDFFYDAARSDVARELDVSQSRTRFFLVYAAGYTALSYLMVFGAERLTRLVFNEPESAANPSE